jgi:hypothetical protein
LWTTRRRLVEAGVVWAGAGCWEGGCVSESIRVTETPHPRYVLELPPDTTKEQFQAIVDAIGWQAVALLKSRIVTEWYNGNMDESVMDRLIGDAP